MGIIYVEIEENWGISEDSRVTTVFDEFFEENLSVEDKFNLMCLLNLQENVKIKDDYFNLFLREDEEFIKFLDEINARNYTEYKKWLISIPLNSNFAMFRTKSFALPDNFEKENCETSVVNNDERDNILYCSLTDGYIKTIIAEGIGERILINYKHLEGNIEFEVLVNGNQDYHYKFSQNETNWRIIDIKYNKNLSQEIELKFSGNGKFYLHCLAVVEQQDYFYNPSEFKFSYNNTAIEMENYAKNDNLIFVIDKRTYKKEAFASWSYLTARQYNYLKSVFNVPIIIKRHDYFLQPALITSMNVNYDRLGKGVIANIQLQLF